MAVIQKTADWLLTTLAPKTTAAACFTCQDVECYCAGGVVYLKRCCPNSACAAVCGGCFKTDIGC